MKNIVYKASLKKGLHLTLIRISDGHVCMDNVKDTNKKEDPDQTAL